MSEVEYENNTNFVGRLKFVLITATWMKETTCESFLACPGTTTCTLSCYTQKRGIHGLVSNLGMEGDKKLFVWHCTGFCRILATG